jgi:saccharopine dehydrogenase-like NADP-dependent oxidoreductase
VARYLSPVNTLVCIIVTLIAYYYYHANKMVTSIQNLRTIVAVAGGTGQLGTHIIQALLSTQLSPKFQEVRLLTANTSSEKATALASKGAKPIAVDYSDEKTLLNAIKRADVVINALGGRDFLRKMHFVMQS